MGVRENKVEKYLDMRFTRIGGTTRKYKSPGHDGVSDRLCMLPHGRIWFVEVKTLDGTESSAQERERMRMAKMGFHTWVAYGEAGVDALMDMIING